MSRSGNYSELTNLQRVRDEEIVEKVRALYVSPLLDDLEREVPGYRSMDEKEKVEA